MTRVLHLVQQAYPESPGGVERYLYFLMQKASNSSSESISNKIEFIQRTSSSFGIHQPYGIKPQIMGHPFEIENRIKKFISNNSIDIIHVHHPAPFGLSLLYKLAEIYPLILHWHDYFILCQRTQLLDYQSQICSGPSLNKCTICIQNKKKIIKKLLMPFSMQWRMINAYKLMQTCAAIVIPQSNISKAIPKNFRPKCIVIPYQSEPEWELDLNLAKNQKILTNLKTNSWCVLGGPSYHKGVFDLIDEMKTINFTGELNIFGEGWNNITKLPSFVRIRGRLLSNKQLDNCSHWIIPSKWKETGPLVAIEAYKIGLKIWARKGSISSHMANLCDVSIFDHARDINTQIKRNHSKEDLPSWKSILRSYELLYTKLK